MILYEQQIFLFLLSDVNCILRLSLLVRNKDFFTKNLLISTYIVLLFIGMYA